MAELDVEYVHRPPRARLGYLLGLLILIFALAAPAAIGLISGQVVPASGWLLLACSVVLAPLLLLFLIVTVAPSVVETGVSATGDVLTVHLPWRAARVIPFAAVSKLEGVIPASASIYDDGVSFTVHWDGQSITLSEELLMKSGWYGRLRNLPRFDEVTYSDAWQRKLRGFELVTGRRFLLWRRENDPGLRMGGHAEHL